MPPGTSKSKNYYWTCQDLDTCDTVVEFCSTIEWYVVDSANEAWLLAQAKMKAAWDAFHSKGKELFVSPNPLRIIARALNSLRLSIPIKQPRWRAGRWKSKT